MGMGRWGRATRLVLLMLVVGMLGKTAISPVGAQEATPVTTEAATPAGPSGGEPCTITAGNDFYATPKDTALNDPDPGVFANDNSSTTFTLFDVLPAAHGMATVGSMGELNYTPDAGFVGTDIFQYKIYCMNEAGEQSYATGIVSIAVGGTTSVCMLADDAYVTPKNTVLNVKAPGVLVNDSLPVPFTMFGTLIPSAHGTATVGAAGELTYTPDAGYEGNDSFEYAVVCAEDGVAVLRSAMVTVTVGDVPPAVCTLADDAYVTTKDTVLNVPDPGVFANDSLIPGFSSSVAAPAVHGTATVGAAGELNYTPDAGFVGNDSFQYGVACDEGGVTVFHTAVVTINVVDGTVPTATSVPSTNTPVPTIPTTPGPGVTQTPVTAQPTAPSVSKLPVTGAGTSGVPSLPAGAIMLGALVMAGALAVAGLRRGHAKR